MLSLFLVAALGCTSTTNIEQFKERVKAACAQPDADKWLKGVDVSSLSPSTIRFTITFRKDMNGLPVGGAPHGTWLRQSSEKLYEKWSSQDGKDIPSFSRYEFVYRDGENRPVCGFAWEVGKAEPVTARCYPLIPGEADSPKEWWQ